MHLKRLFFILFVLILMPFCALSLWGFSYLDWMTNIPSNILNWISLPGSPSPPKIKPCHVHRNYEWKLKMELVDNIVGQHIAVPYVENAISAHFQDSDPRHALTMIFSGGTGVGKNFISTLVGKAIFGEDNKHFVHLYSGRSDFPDYDKISIYRTTIRNDIERLVRECSRSIFIFDEIDKMPPGIIDVIKPYIDFHPYYKGINYRKTTFLFLTNIGAPEIFSVYQSQMNKGTIREHLKYAHFEPILRTALFEAGEGLFGGSQLIEDHSISFYLPFLPLQRKHVIACIASEMRRQGFHNQQMDSVSNVLEKIEFVHRDFSTSGCKRVGDHVSTERFKTLRKNKDL